PSPRIAAPAGIGTTPAFLHAAGTDVVALLDGASGVGYLARIAPPTGAVTRTGPALAITGYSGGVSAFDAAAGRIFFTATSGGARRLFVASAATLAVLSSAPISVPAGDLIETPWLVWNSRPSTLYTLLRAAAAGG